MAGSPGAHAAITESGPGMDEVEAPADEFVLLRRTIEQGGSGATPDHA
ncbi:hypothetical protein [[Kitasatospora] papulosa]